MTDEERKKLSDRMRKTMSRPDMKERARRHALSNNSNPEIQLKNSLRKKGKPGWKPTEEQRLLKSLKMRGRQVHPNFHGEDGRFVKHKVD